MKTLALPVIAAVAALSATIFPLTSIADSSSEQTRYNTQTVGDVEVFYREAGALDAPVLLLLHGFPSSSHQYRELMPLLADQYRVIAPDYPGFGSTVAPPRGEYEYSFDNLAQTIDGFTEALKLDSYAMYVFDYGAPIGFRLAVENPERITAIISQNGNAYEEGLSDAWGPIRALWAEPSVANRDALLGL
jgi:pimeloyl-ACP methyl ester carboxylesterase